MQFARDNPHIKVVGVGAGSNQNGDSLAGAMEFAEFFGTEAAGMSMLYDESFRTWRTFSVSSQPWTLVFDAAGNLVVSQPGRIDFSTIPNAL